MKTTEEPAQLIANTRNQGLSQHLFAVGFIAYQLLDTLSISNTKLKQAAFIAGIFHDIGKIDPVFQSWLHKKISKPLGADVTDDDGVHVDAPTKFSFDKHPRHHELSWLLTDSLLAGCSLNDTQRGQIAHTIYWHHTKPFRKDDQFINPEAIYAVFKHSLVDETFEDVYRGTIELMKDVETIATKFSMQSLLPELNPSFKLQTESLPGYKKYVWMPDIKDYNANIQINALNNLIRSAVISADRLVSGCTRSELNLHILEGSLGGLVSRISAQETTELSENITQCLQGFETYPTDIDRNQAQSKAAKDIAELKKVACINKAANIAVLQGPAGCGKTKIALEWALHTDVKKIIWVCPRVQVCLGLLNDLTERNYLPNSRIEIFTGEYKKILSKGVSFDDAADTAESEYFSGDIVITTIDQIVNSIRSHSHVTTFIHFLSAHVVFDEFHELVNIAAFNLLFAELIESKRQQGYNANTLLVSATPHYFYLTELLGILHEDIFSIASFNKSIYRIDFVTYDERVEVSPLVSTNQGAGTFVITNTAQEAQLGYIRHRDTEKSVLIHSKYTKQDTAFLFHEVLSSFKRNGDQKYEVLRSGPIVQAALNITCYRMLTEITCAENWLQRLGRLDRFGDNAVANKYTTVVPVSIYVDGKQTSSCAKFLNHLCLWNSTKAWLNYLKSAVEDTVTLTINQLYTIYKEFYTEQKVIDSIRKDLSIALKNSVSLINKKVIDPISVPPKAKINPSDIKVSSYSLRGDNRFVQMAVCAVSEDNKLTFTEGYAYSEYTNHILEPAALVASITSMRGYGDDDANLVQFMQKKHHNIKKEDGHKKARNEWELIKEARSPERPIYLSYTPKDLSKVASNPHPHAVYYVVSDKQPVGAMSITQITKINNSAQTAVLAA